MKQLIPAVLALAICAQTFAQTPIYKDPHQPIEKRIKDLLSKMTPEEKFWQLFMIPGDILPGEENKFRNGIFGIQLHAAQRKGDAGAQMLDYNTSDDAAGLRNKINAAQKIMMEQTRLGIPMIAFEEGLHGLVRGGATIFPQAIALGATWDTTLMGHVALAIAAEARIRGIRDILSPVINIAADPRWGRVEETYGEDPFLTSAMAVSFVSAFERNGIVTTPKHFVANVGDGGKDSYPIDHTERLLNDIYLPPFKACIELGGSRSIMTAYNSLDGVPCSANSWLLNKTLKGDWKFKGFVISDANAVAITANPLYTAPNNTIAAQQAITGGLDVIFESSYDYSKAYMPAFLDSSIDKQRIDDAVSRVLRAKFELGLFDHPYAADSNVDMHAHKALARQAALESIVLLKNVNNILPLSTKTHTIAVIGADAAEARLGGYSGPGNNKISILQGIRERAGSDIDISYAAGCGRRNAEWTVVPASALTLKGEYYNNLDLSGTPAETRIDKNINFLWTLSTPAKQLGHDFYSVRWTGTLHAPKTGRFHIGLDGNDGYRLYIDNQLVIDNWKKQTYSTILREKNFEQGHDYSIRVEFFEPVGNARLKLIWDMDAPDLESRIDSAINTAQKADIAVVVAGINEGEFQDRASLALPGRQEEMIRRIAATGKPVIVLLVGGSAITMASWLDSVQGVMDVWYPGEEGGPAVAGVLFGDYDPAGRLPISFPISEAQLPWVYDHAPTGRGDDYNNLSGLPLFPFGFGLSYTHFEYGNLKQDSTHLSCMVKNTGSRDGDEVVQFYIRKITLNISHPVLELKGFQRIHLQAGESKTVSFDLLPDEPADYQLMIGASSRDLRLKTRLKVN